MGPIGAGKGVRRPVDGHCAYLGLDGFGGGYLRIAPSDTQTGQVVHRVVPTCGPLRVWIVAERDRARVDFTPCHVLRIAPARSWLYVSRPSSWWQACDSVASRASSTLFPRSRQYTSHAPSPARDGSRRSYRLSGGSPRSGYGVSGGEA